MNREIPSEQDWEEYWKDLDSNYAHRIFFGKSNTEAQPDFSRSVLERVSELSYMPIKPFQYYVFGLLQYIESLQLIHLDMPDATSSFLSLIEHKIKTNPNFVLPILNDLMPALEKIAANQKDYGADIDIYGVFTDKLNNIKQALQNA